MGSTKPAKPHKVKGIRPAIEIIAAHDILEMVVAGEVPSPWDPDHNPAIVSARDVLCWVLGHQENPHFGENLQFLISFLEEKGIHIALKPPEEVVPKRRKRGRRSGKKVVRRSDDENWGE